MRVPEAEIAILKYKDLKMRPYYSVTYGHIQKGSVNVEVGSRDYSHLKKVLNKQKFSQNVDALCLNNKRDIFENLSLPV